jgi:hypothetical protein
MVQIRLLPSPLQFSLCNITFLRASGHDGIDGVVQWLDNWPQSARSMNRAYVAFVSVPYFGVF